jgi:hypothetical protein
MVVKKKSKVTKGLLAASFFICVIAIVPSVVGSGTNHIFIFAKGDDGDIAGATTFILGMIDYDKDTGVPTGNFYFQTKLYDDSGKKVYSMKGMLKDALVVSDNFQYYCTVREVLWTNLWFIMGDGLLKTTDENIEIDFRDVGTITLPNTKGKYVPCSFWVMVNPKGEYMLGEDPEVFIWPEGGWATVVIVVDGMPAVGVVTYLTRYIEI